MNDWDHAVGSSVEEELADRVVAEAGRRRLRRATWVGGGLLTVAIAVAVPVLAAHEADPTTSAQQRAAAGSGETAGSTATATVPGTGTGTGTGGVSDQAAIYAAALTSPSPASTPTELFVRDQVCATVVSEPGSQCADSPIPMSVRHELGALLPFPVHFVAQRWGPRTGRVHSLTVFGSLTIDGARATLGVETLCGPLCGEGKTLVLTRVDRAWRVTGSTGPEWIS